MNLFDYTAANPYQVEEMDPNDLLVEEEAIEQGKITLRPYQTIASESIYRHWNGYDDPETGPVAPVQSTMIVCPTGCGKTVIIADVLAKRPKGRAMVIAHREELIYQGQATIEAVTGSVADIEMADRYAGSSDIVIATVQTLSRGRIECFKPQDFSVLVVDENHHAVADSYVKVLNHFKANPSLKVLGVTATPDRADEEALGKVFDSVAFDYELTDAIRDGWLVPILCQPVQVHGLDYSSIRTTAGDLNGADLEAVLTAETPLHKMTQAVIEIGLGLKPATLDPLLDLEPAAFIAAMAETVAAHRLRKCLVFAITVAHAEKLAEILNRWMPGCAKWVCGKTPKDERAAMFADFKRGAFKVLVNVGIASEGFDEPSIEVLVLGRPTKSRALYSQMVGRSTRALPGVVDGPQTPELRRAAIAASEKPHALVVDFVGNTGRHQLVSTADLLGGNYEDDVIERAQKIIEKATEPMDAQGALEEAQRLRDEAKARAAAQKARLRVRSSYTVGEVVDVFKLLGVTPFRERGWQKGKEITPKMKECLERNKVWEEGMTYSTASQIIQGMHERRTKGLCTIRQAKTIARAGFPASTSFVDAGRIITVLAANNWHWPQGVPRPGATG